MREGSLSMSTQENSWIKVLRMIISISLLLGIFVTVICDVAITGGLSWSLYPVVSILFVWIVILPILYFKKYRIFFSLIVGTVLIIPYLMILDRIIGVAKYMLPIGIPIATITMIYIWAIYLLFSIKRMGMWYSLAITVLLCIPLSYCVNYVIYNVLNEPALQIWDVFSYVIIACLSLYLFFMGRKKARYAA